MAWGQQGKEAGAGVCRGGGSHAKEGNGHKRQTGIQKSAETGNQSNDNWEKHVPSRVSPNTKEARILEDLTHPGGAGPD